MPAAARRLWPLAACTLVLALLPGAEAEYQDPLDPDERSRVSEGPFRVVLGPTGAPFAFEEEGIHKGLAVDVLRLVSVETGIEFETSLAADFNEAYGALASGEADIYGPAVPDPRRGDTVLYTQPFAWPRFGFWVGPAMASATSPHDLDGHRVAVPNSTVHLRTLGDRFPGVLQVPVQDVQTGVEMVANGSVEAVYSGYANVGMLLRSRDDLALRPLGEPVLMTEATWAVRGADPLLHAALAKGLAAIEPDQLEALHLKWTGAHLGPAASHSTSPAVFWVLAATGGAVALLTAHTTVLRRQVRSRTRQLTAERDKFARIMETNPGPVLVTAPDGRVLYANHRAERVLRLDQDSVGRWPRPGWQTRGLQGGPLPPDQEPLARVVASRAPVHGQRLMLRWPDGYQLPVSCNAAPLLDAEGAVIAVVLALEDLQDHLAAEQAQRKDIERRAEMQRLQEINAFRTEFMNAAAHEIKTPLTPLAMQLHLLERDATGMSPTQRRAVKVLRRNLQRLSQIAHDMLDITRIESGHLPIERRPVDIAELVDAACQALADMAQEHGVDVTAHTPGPVPIEVDPDRITQVIKHLLSNAIKFTPQNGRVELRLEDDEQEVRLEVVDSGIGLSKDQQERLFLPFARLHTDRHEAPGSGLGLHMSKRIVEAHGGTIACHSQGADLGSTFSVCLPRRVLVPQIELTA